MRKYLQVLLLTSFVGRLPLALIRATVAVRATRCAGWVFTWVYTTIGRASYWIAGANRARISRTVSPHVLRHTFAVTAIQKGISLPTLQRLLGHDTLLTTEINLNLSPEHVVEEFQQKW